jgi:AraC-like DNA-binding protein
MHDFYRKALIRLLLLLAASGLIAILCISQSYLQESLLPAGDGALAWELATRTDSHPDNHSTIRAHLDQARLVSNFRLSNQPDRNAATALLFKDKRGQSRLVDLSRYRTISFVARCRPSNEFMITIPVFDDLVSKRDDLLTYRTVYGFFSCSESDSRVELDLTRLTVAQWWFDMYKIDLTRQGYKLDKVPKIEFGNTLRAAIGVDSHLEIADIKLHGRDRRYLALLAVLLVLMWSAYGLWFFRAHARALVDDLQTKMQRDMQLVAYQQLSIEPHRDKEKSTILRFMATRYADSDLDLDTVVTETGANRNKVNDILKAELGYTFSTYLNKLRLTEAARLLAESDTATIAEIAYSVGYKNVTYFNRLFKEEYNCTPKSFREIYRKPS